jgi:hypothetical protein
MRSAWKLDIFAALAEFEPDLIRERTTAGLAAVRAIATAPGVSRASIYRQALQRFRSPGQSLRTATDLGIHSPLPSFAVPQGPLRCRPRAARLCDALSESLSCRQQRQSQLPA